MSDWQAYSDGGIIPGPAGHDSSAQMSDKYLYGKMPAEAEPADGVKGVLIRARDGTMMFRVYHDNKGFTDYEIRHDDLSVTIDNDALAAFYSIGERNILDHSPRVLGLEKVDG